MSSLRSSITANLTSRAIVLTVLFATSSGIRSASSSVQHIPTQTTSSNKTRIIDVTVSLINEDFHKDLLNESSAKFMNLSRRVNSTVGISDNFCYIEFNDLNYFSCNPSKLVIINSFRVCNTRCQILIDLSMY